MHPGSNQWHLIDYVLVRGRDVQDLCIVRVMHGADCSTDHRLVRARVKCVVHKKERQGGVSLPKRLNVSRLQVSEVRQNLVNKMDDFSK